MNAGVYTPYFNRWNADAYTRSTPFAEQPFALPASSTSGATLATDGRCWVGLTLPGAGWIRWDGHRLEAQPETAEGFAFEGDNDSAWAAYHQALDLPPAPAAPLGRVPEYCTWVEQKWLAAQRGLPPPAALTTKLVDDYLHEIARHRWPAGRFTLDEGWCPRHGPGGFGDWEPRADLDLPALARAIASAGHVPGLWLAPQLISPTSRLAGERPDLVGEAFAMEAESGWAGYRFLRPGSAAVEWLSELFARVAGWGFRKLKLDICYGPKVLMIALHQACAQALPVGMELEGHLPDPFAARHVAVVRLNDVLISPRHPGWRTVAEAHFRVCRESAPGHLLCLDHLGGNDVTVTETQWLEHAALMRRWLPDGYPVISLLPHHVGPRAVTATTELLAAATARI